MVLCEHAAVLANGGPVLVGIFRGIGVDRLPGRLDPFFIACEVEAELGETGENHELELRMIDQDGAVFYNRPIEVFFERREDFAASYAYFAGPIEIEDELPSAGTYRFDLIYKEDVIGQAKLEVQTRN